ncbi:family 14 glycosylhydrolase [Roseicella frigidaeris]|uniref:Asl1-like glycosyl hydrolase catalytic domain-containing protein n=1 Tax=Roseicella frigidaeris TaxID=2230885 RepID=A0A327M3W4_9PROT|nr:hypothetical protein DOO78_15865 [Roseicella frigidaeris]
MAVPSGQLGFSTPLGELVNPGTSAMNAEMSDYQNLGADWIRTNFWWDTIQPNRNGGYDWSELDRMVSAAKEHGLKVVAELSLTPRWGGIDADGYAKFAKAAAEHFGDSVNYWELGNEPNLKMGVSEYMSLQKAAYSAIKSVSSGDTVISGGLSPAPETGWGHIGAVDFLKGMYAQGAADSMDAVGYHAYTWPEMPSSSNSWNGWQIMEDGIRDTMVRNGDADTQVWITEFGSPTRGYNSVSQDQQAQALREAVDLAHHESWVGPIMYYSYQDRGGNTGDSENWFGVVGPNGEHKAVYDAYKALATNDDWA